MPGVHSGDIASLISMTPGIELSCIAACARPSTATTKGPPTNAAAVAISPTASVVITRLRTGQRRSHHDAACIPAENALGKRDGATGIQRASLSGRCNAGTIWTPTIPLPARKYIARVELLADATAIFHVKDSELSNRTGITGWLLITMFEPNKTYEAGSDRFGDRLFSFGERQVPVCDAGLALNEGTNWQEIDVRGNG